MHVFARIGNCSDAACALEQNLEQQPVLVRIDLSLHNAYLLQTSTLNDGNKNSVTGNKPSGSRPKREESGTRQLDGGLGGPRAQGSDPQPGRSTAGVL